MSYSGGGMSYTGGEISQVGPSQERADLEALAKLAEDAFPRWRWDHTTIDLPQIRKYDKLAIHDALIEGPMLVAGVAHDPSAGNMRLDLLDSETFDRRAKTMALNRQLAKLRGEEQVLREQSREGATGSAQGLPGRADLGGRVWPLAGDSTNDPRASYHARAAGGPGGGSDLMAARGMPILAMIGGTVTSVGSTGPGGNNVIISGTDGLEYYYAHMDAPPPVRQGDKVTTGQRIGAVGETGNAVGTGYHLHIAFGHGISNGVGASGGMGINYPQAEDILASLRPNASRT